jgi:hypothetical protein
MFSTLSVNISFLYFISWRGTPIFTPAHPKLWSNRWHCLLRQCAASWKVADSFPVEPWLNSSGRIMFLGLNQLLIEVIIRNISRIIWKSDCLNFLEPSEPVQAFTEFALITPAGKQTVHSTLLIILIACILTWWHSMWLILTELWNL